MMTLKILLEVDMSELDRASSVMGDIMYTTVIKGTEPVPVPEIAITNAIGDRVGSWKIVDTAVDDLVGKTMLWDCNSGVSCEVRVIELLPEKGNPLYHTAIREYAVCKLDDNYTYYAREDELKEIK